MIRIAGLTLASVLMLTAGCLQAGAVLDEGAGASARELIPENAPRRLSPQDIDDASADFLQLRWTASPGAVEYEVYIGLDKNPPLLTTVTTTSIQVRDLSECMEHYWRVVAVDADGKTVSSSMWTFTTRCN